MTAALYNTVSKVHKSTTTAEDARDNVRQTRKLTYVIGHASSRLHL